MKIALSKKLKKRAHLELASLQDEVVDIFYSLNPEAVLHGGTAIWRCYDGNRFSEDLDFYSSLEGDFDKKLKEELEKRGLILQKYKKAPYVVFAKITNNRTTVRLEITSKKPQNKELKKYEKIDATYIDIYTLSPDELIKEKMGAYLGRKFIRDIYDIYHLSSYVQTPIQGIKGFLDKLPPPIDEENLKTLVYSGVSPSFKEIVKILKRRFK